MCTKLAVKHQSSSLGCVYVLGISSTSTRLSFIRSGQLSFQEWTMVVLLYGCYVCQFSAESLFAANRMDFSRDSQLLNAPRSRTKTILWNRTMEHSIQISTRRPLQRRANENIWTITFDITNCRIWRMRNKNGWQSEYMTSLVYVRLIAQFPNLT